MALLRKIIEYPIIIVLVVTFIILIPIFLPGFFSIHDETHIVDVYQMIRSLELGGFPPRFIPDVNFGLGYPYFNFYYHLPFYITTVFHYSGFSLTDSFKYMMALAVVLATSGFYFFLSNHVGKIASFVGTLFFLFSPYFAVDIYVRGAFGELWLFALFPWAGFFLYKYLSDSKLKNLSLAAIPIFLISISHNVLLPFIFGLLFLYGVVALLILKTSIKKSLRLLLPFILGVLLGAYYLLPALVEIKYISSYEQFNLADHFPFIKQLIIPHWGYGPSIWGPLDDISFDIGTFNLIAVLASFFIFKRAKRPVKILLIFFWIIFGLAVVLMNSRTLLFWESIRFLRLVQFPWRMLIFTTFSSSFIAAILVQAIFDKVSPKKGAVALILIMIIIGFLNLWHYNFSESKNTTDEEYLSRYFANRTLKGERGELSQEYLNFTEDFIPPTIWQSKRPANLLREMEFATGSGDLNFETRGLSYDIEYQAPVPNKIIVSKTYFPGWQAESNGKQLKVEPYSEYGIMAIPIEEGNGRIHLSFENTPIRTIANLISASALILILVLLFYGIRRYRDVSSR